MPELTPQEQRLQLLIDYKEAFATDHGARVLDDMRRAFWSDRQTFVSERPHDTAFNCGLREAWLYVNRQINMDPALLAKRQADTIDTQGEDA